MTYIPKRGDIREDGRIFWVRAVDKKTGKATIERWYTPDHFIRAYIATAFIQARSRAKLQGVPFNLTKEHLTEIFPTDLICPIMQRKMSFSDECRSNRPSLDKIVPEKGYVNGNVMWMCLEANRIKDNASLDVLKRLVAVLETRENS